jgi:hypothetical protein
MDKLVILLGNFHVLCEIKSKSVTEHKDRGIYLKFEQKENDIKILPYKRHMETYQKLLNNTGQGGKGEEVWWRGVYVYLSTVHIPL